MKRITSRDNPLFKELKRLAGSSPARRRAGKALLEGVHLCQAYLARVGAPVICLAGASALDQPEVASIAASLSDDKRVLLDDGLFSAIGQVENGRAIAFLIDVPGNLPPAPLDRCSVLLDRLQDPGNLGSILRSSAAAGIGRIYCSEGTVAAWSPKVLRAGMGAHFHLEIFEDCKLASLIEHAKVPVIATSPYSRRTLYQCDLREDVAWIFGNEGSGVASDFGGSIEWIGIPQPGGPESLNVGAAAAVCLFEQVRQRL